MPDSHAILLPRTFRRRLVQWLLQSGVLSFTSGFAVGAVWWYIWGVRRGYFPIYFGPSSKRWERAGWNEAEQEVLRAWESDGGKLEMRLPSVRNFLGGANQARRVWYQWVWFESEKCVRGLVRYGTDTEGPPRCVHGGCTATVVDALMGYVAWASTKKWVVTRNLEVNYRKFVPIGSTVQVHAWFDKEDGRKVFCKFEVWSFDRKSLHNEGSALFIDSQAKKVTVNAMTDTSSGNAIEQDEAA